MREAYFFTLLCNECTYAGVTADENVLKENNKGKLMLSNDIARQYIVYLLCQ